MKRYLSNWIVSAKGITRLSIITVGEAGQLKSIEPFGQEIANTEFVQGVIVAVAKETEVSRELIAAHIGEDNAKTAENIFNILSNCDNQEVGWGIEVVLYAVDSSAHSVKRLQMK